MNVFVCICSEEYLPYYQVLYDSLKPYGIKQLLYFIGENVPTCYDEVINITHWYNEANKFYNNKLQSICSLRARAVLDANLKGYNKICFTGAKLEFFQNPKNYFYDLINSDVIYTPHIIEPLPEDGLFPSNASVSFTGHISTDLIFFNTTSEKVIKFLKWQDNIMQTQCVNGPKTYLDQSWLNFLPSFVDFTHMDRNPALNCAYWRLNDNNFHKSNDMWCIEDNPLIAFQYSGLDINTPMGISTYQIRYTASGDLLEFLTIYSYKI